MATLKSKGFTLLGARVPSPAQRAQHAQSFLALNPQTCSRFALNADEGVRAPGKSGRH